MRICEHVHRQRRAVRAARRRLGYHAVDQVLHGVEVRSRQPHLEAAVYGVRVVRPAAVVGAAWHNEVRVRRRAEDSEVDRAVARGDGTRAILQADHDP